MRIVCNPISLYFWIGLLFFSCGAMDPKSAAQSFFATWKLGELSQCADFWDIDSILKQAEKANHLDLTPPQRQKVRRAMKVALKYGCLKAFQMAQAQEVQIIRLTRSPSSAQIDLIFKPTSFHSGIRSLSELFEEYLARQKIGRKERVEIDGPLDRVDKNTWVWRLFLAKKGIPWQVRNLQFLKNNRAAYPDVQTSFNQALLPSKKDLTELERIPLFP